jgi:hypothetical protein
MPSPSKTTKTSPSSEMGKQVAKRKTSTPEERAAKKAFEVETKIKKGVGAIRQVWIALAGFLHEFYTDKMWEHLGYDKFEVWLGTPEIGLGRSQVYALIEAYEELVVKREVEADCLADLEATKIAVVLPALRKGEVGLEDALADVESLSRSELRQKYGKALPAERIPLIECEDCGCMKRPKSDDEAQAVDPNQIALEETDAP